MWEALGDYHGPPRLKVFVRYVAARALREVRDMSYRVYVTDSLRCTPQMMYIPTRWADLIDRMNKPVPQKSPDDIIDGVISKLRG